MRYFLTHWLPSIIAAGGLVLAMVWVVRYKLPWMLERIEKLEKKSHTQEVTGVDLVDVVRKKELYGEDGVPLYQHRSNCADMQEICQQYIFVHQGRLKQRICAKVEEVKQDVAGIKTTLKDMDKAREDAKEKLVKVIQRVEDMVSLDRTQELKTLADMIVKKINGDSK